MAIIAEMTVRGAKVRIHDDFVSTDPEEIAARKRRRNMVAGQILDNMARRLAEEEQRKGAPDETIIYARRAGGACGV